MIQLLTQIFSKSSNLEQLFSIKVKTITKCTSCNNINESIVTDNFWTLYLEVILENFLHCLLFKIKVYLKENSFNINDLILQSLTLENIGDYKCEK